MITRLGQGRWIKIEGKYFLGQLSIFLDSHCWKFIKDLCRTIAEEIVSVLLNKSRENSI